VVRNRLTEAGLGAYLLELHSHKATRKEVAVSLGQALDTKPVPPGAMPGLEVEAVRKRREQLNSYAEAMNRKRDPLGYSLHDVLGMIAHLRAVPAAPATGVAPVDLTVEAFGEIRRTTATLAAAWRPAAQGRSFVWRDVTERGSLDARLYQAASALEALAGMVRVNETLASATGLTRPSHAAALADLLSHLHSWPPEMPDEWLMAGTLDEADAMVTHIAAAIATIAARESRAADAAGVPWSAIPPPAALPAIGDGQLTALTPACADVSGLTGGQITGLAQAFSRDADLLQNRLASLSGLASMLGLQPPVTFSEAADLLTLTRLAEETDRPERAWLSAPGRQAARQASEALSCAWRALADAETGAGPYYTSTALGQDLDGLVQRFEKDHHGLGKLSGEYRADKKAVAAFTKEGVARDAAHENLKLAAAWRHAAQALTETEARHAALLGAYYTGRDTDFDRLSRALAHAGTALRCSRGQDLSQAAGHICQDESSNPVISTIAVETLHDLSAWQATLAPVPAIAPRPELITGTIPEAITWLQAHLEPLQAASVFTREAGEVVGRQLTFSDAQKLVELRREADSAHAQLGARDADFQQACGSLYAGAATDVAAMRRALEWARRLRSMITGGPGPLSSAQLKAARGAIPTGHLADAAITWSKARDGLLAGFSENRRPDLAAELDDYDDGAELITALLSDTGGRDEWHAYQSARAALAAHGLDAAVGFCITERVEPERIPRVIERAVLQEWAEHHLRTDPHLAPVRAEERDDLVREYQKLDKALIAAATGDIIRACNARRPRSDIGEAAVIHREAEKKRKHMPVRVLIERSRHVTQAIKPCFMMSPLSVSQYLSADMHFDIVIFDEASQVTPADAINCIYRGSALILAGDQKQLPPTSFFGPGGADDGEEWSEESEDTSDFESILDLAKGSGAYKNLALRWHYRSRHEALIAFSNTAFYGGSLVTFPSRHSDGPDVGVELYWGDGTYRRGTSRDNPAEAARVVERVIHHYDTRPHLTLGVVTFSEAQAEAVETAVSQAREQRPDLDKFFTNDRLQGFFIKNLESVQGDERDVLIFSIGYGHDENRKITMNFGPLNKQGGWRRLNVAITRARYRNEIVSSIRAGDIPESVTSEGLRHLRRYLDYAARGLPALALDTATGGDAESPFEESVINVIRSWGYALTPQVGTAGYRIDIGVHHPGHPGVYALGVECDGYQYHSSRVARDRDRLREKVLRDLGWHLHRIWGTAWYRNRNGEESRLRTAIERAIAAPVHGLLTDDSQSGEIHRPAVQTEQAIFDAKPAWAVPYQVAGLFSLPHWADPADPGSVYAMTGPIRAVVGKEGPVHISLLHHRLRDAWHLGRIGARIRDNIDAAIRLAGVIRESDFLMPASPQDVFVRTPTQACARSVEQVHGQELALALIGLVRDARSISHNELTTGVARLYGWNRRGPDITSRMDALISALLRNGTFEGDEQALRLASPTAERDLMQQRLDV
jgi:REase_MTES_1575/AAA domain/Protein of unknown function (DUF3320)